MEATAPATGQNPLSISLPARGFAVRGRFANSSSQAMRMELSKVSPADLLVRRGIS